MVPFVFLLLLVVVVFLVAFGVRQSQLRAARTEGLTQIAQRHGWQISPDDDSYASRWSGEPFTKGGKVRNVVTGDHQSRPFTAFEYWYTTSSYNGTTNTTVTHTFTVWALQLPGDVPEMSVGPEGLFGGKVAEAFGFGRIDTDDAGFNDAFKVKSDDEQFAQVVLSPEVITVMKQHGDWQWRFTGNTMLSWEADTFDPEDLVPRLDLMMKLVTAVPGRAWER